MGIKGDWPRPSSIGREERELREKLFEKRITFKQFEKEYRRLHREGKITRNGRVIGNAR